MTMTPSSGNAPARMATWYRPTISPEHGIYIMLLVSFVTGAAAAQQWIFGTTLALACAFLGFQAEHPLVLQIKQRKSWKPRFILWASIYSSLALAIAVYLGLQIPVLWGLYGGAIAATAIDAICVFYRRQKSFVNELLTFAAVCLASPFAYIATTSTWTVSLLGLWLINTLFFSSAIFTVKLRKPKTASVIPGVVYHAIACVLIGIFWYLGWMETFVMSGFPIPQGIAFAVALCKFGLILARSEWYRTTPIQNVAMLETISALLFLAIVAIPLLPAHL